MFIFGADLSITEELVILGLVAGGIWYVTRG